MRKSILIFCMLPFCLMAQMSVQDAQDIPFSPENLISDVFLGKGVEIVNIQFDGNPASTGFFSEGQSTIGLDQGILLTTGVVESSGANRGVLENGSSDASVDNQSAVVDTDANMIASATVLNVTRFVIEFIPSTDKISFKYVFASEEYPEFVCSDYSDIFGLFISGPGITGTFSNNAENLAVIPGTNLPLTINNVNGGVVGSQGDISNCNGTNGTLDYSQFYIDNDASSTAPVYDGYLTTFEAEAEVIPCETYTLKIVIADQGDEQRDSGVFLEAKSLNSNSVEASISVNSVDGIVAEGCNEFTISFGLDEPTDEDTEISLSYIGDATNGVDFTAELGPFVIPAGQTSVDLPFSAIADNLTEGVELVGIDFQANQCNRDTFFFGIRDNELILPELIDDTLCVGDSGAFDAMIQMNGNDMLSFSSSNGQEAIISPPPTGSPIFPLTSNLTVSNMDAVVLSPQLIESVCLDIQHSRLEDLDIYLFSPEGSFIPLSLNNGSTGANYTNTCFSSDATQFIGDASAPFTGSFIPEGNWSDLNGNVINGIWQIMIIDNVFGFNGILENWSITFNSSIDLNYSWTPSIGLSCLDCPNPTFSPSASTTYTVEATDGYGCMDSKEVRVEVLDLPQEPMLICAASTDSDLTLEWDPITNADNVEINIDGSGWIVPNGNNSHFIDGLSAGQSVEIQVQSINSCGSSSSSIICNTNSCSISLDTEIMEIDCDGNLANIAVIVSGGTGSYDYNWSNVMSTDSLITDLNAGTYTVTVSDAGSGCDETIEIIIDEYIPLSFDVDSTITCANQTDGMATINVANGQSPYDIQWSASAGSQNGMTATNLPGGIHTVTVTDDNNCSFQTAVTIEEQELLEDINAFCVNVTNSTITFGWSEILNADNYEINIDGAGWVQPSNPGTFEETISGLSLGQSVNFEVRVIGQCNTSSNTIDCVTNDCTPITITEAVTNLSCFGDSNGEIMLQASGDYGPFEFTLDGQTNSTGVFTNLSAGEYIIQVEDQASCIESINVTIIEPAELILSPIIINAIDCDNEFGSATLIVEGGVPPYLFNWDLPSSDSIVANLVSGVYTITVTDFNSCINIASVEILPYETIVLTTSSTASDCQGMPSGTATVDVTGGEPPYTYLWSDPNSQTTSTATELEPGQYEVEVQDASSCITVATVNVSTPTMLEISNADIIPLSCYGDSNASIALNVSGGSGNFQYLWDDTNATDGPIIENLPAGEYSVLISDDANCNITASYTIVQPDSISITGSVIDVFCPGDTTGEIAVIVDGGIGNLQYNWSTGDTTLDVANLSAGQYTITVTDSNSCTNEQSFVVSGTNGLELTLLPQDASCDGNDGTVQTIVEGGTPNYTYNWSNNSTSAIINSLSAGTYYLTVTDGQGCTLNDSIAVSGPEAFEATFEKTDVLCEGENTASIQIQILDGIAPFQYRLNNGILRDDSLIENLAAGTYSVEVIDSLGCVHLLPEIEIQEPLPIELILEPSFRVNLGEITRFDPVVVGGVSPYEVLWSGEQSQLLLCLECLETEGEIYNNTSFQLDVADSNGCLQQANVFVFVNKEYNYFAPTAFSPNNDGINDVFTLYGSEGTILNSFQIYNRWGELLFAREGPIDINLNVGWDGIYRNEKMISDVYIWKANLTFLDGVSQVVSGEFTLIK